MGHVQLTFSFLILYLNALYYSFIQLIHSTEDFVKNQLKNLTKSVKNGLSHLKRLILFPFNKDYWTKDQVIKTCLIILIVKSIIFPSHFMILLGIMALFGFEMYLNKDKDLIVTKFNEKMKDINKKLSSVTVREEFERKINKDKKRVW